MTGRPSRREISTYSSLLRKERDTKMKVGSQGAKSPSSSLF